MRNLTAGQQRPRRTVR